MVRINGNDVNCDGKKVIDYINEAGYDKTKIAIELNEDILPKAEYETTVLKDGDVVEVVSFVGGG